MGVATATFVDTIKTRDWRYFDVQLLLYMVLLIGIGVVMGYSAGYNDPSQAAGMTQTVKTLIWASIGSSCSSSPRASTIGGCAPSRCRCTWSSSAC